MAVTYGFFNSSSGDRVYDAEQVSSLFDGLIYDGIFMDIGGAMVVTPQGTGLNLNIAEGRAWFNHTWTLNDSEALVTLDTAGSLWPRYDAVVLEVNFDTRVNSFKIVKGTEQAVPVYPTLTDTATVHQYALAYVYVPVGLTTVTAANITNMVGSIPTPFVTGVVQDFDVTAFVVEWQTQFSEWMTQEQSDYAAWLVDIETDWLAWSTSAQGDFATWLASFVDNLTTEQATNLQLEINAINDRVLSHDVDYYVRTDGNDSNDGTINDSSHAWLTIQHAVDVVTQYDPNGYTITIHVADGTYTGTTSLKPFLGSGEGLISIVGNLSTPSNVYIHTSGTAFNASGHNAIYKITGMKIDNVDGVGAGGVFDACIRATTYAHITVNNIVFGKSWYHLEASYGGYILVRGDTLTDKIWIDGVGSTASNHMYAHDKGEIHYSIYIEIQFVQSFTSFMDAFAVANLFGYIIISNSYTTITTTGKTISGKRYNVASTSIINTLSSGSTYLPGDASGVASTYGQYF